MLVAVQNNKVSVTALSLTLCATTILCDPNVSVVNGFKKTAGKIGANEKEKKR